MCVGLRSVFSVPVHSSCSLNRTNLNNQSVSQSINGTNRQWAGQLRVHPWRHRASAQRGEVELGIRAAARFDGEEQEELIRRGVSGFSQDLLAP